MSKKTLMNQRGKQLAAIQFVLRSFRRDREESGKEYGFITDALLDLREVQLHIRELHKIIGYGTYQQGKAYGYKLGKSAVDNHQSEEQG